MWTKLYTFLAVVVFSLCIPPLLRKMSSNSIHAGFTGRISGVPKSQLHEVADLMLEIYETLAKMRYIDPAGIQKGPHDISSMEYLYQDFGIDPSVVYLYSILPYIDIVAAGNSDFLQGSEFANFLDEEHVEQGRDPFYGSPEGDDFEAENGPYMRPWMTPLSMLGNHQSVILYDARRHRIWIIDQENWGSTDLALEGVQSEEADHKNTNKFDHIPSRPAGDVLRDIASWYRSLKLLPGGGEHSDGDWDHHDKTIDLKGLYQKNGWPDEFDGDAFEVDQARAYAASRAKYFAEEPLRAVETYEHWKKYGERQLPEHEKAVKTAKSKEDEWIARFMAWRAMINNALIEIKLREAQNIADRLCPNGVCQKQEDLPLWEVEFLRKEYDWIQREAVQASEEVDHDSGHDGLKHAKKREEIYRRALIQAENDAERLCLGRSFEPDTDNIPSGMTISEEYRGLVTELLQEWLSSIPSDVVKAKELTLAEFSKFLDNSIEMQIPVL